MLKRTTTAVLYRATARQESTRTSNSVSKTPHPTPFPLPHPPSQTCLLSSLLTAITFLLITLSAHTLAPLTCLAAGHAWTQEKGYRHAPLVPNPAQTEPGFTLLNPTQLGISFTNRLTDQKIGQYQNTMNGSGLAAADFDRDGLCDLFLCNKEGPSALYRNLGNGTFTNVTERAGLALTHQLSVGAIFADFNADGYPDLFVTSFGGPNALMMNQGDGTFRDTTQEAGLTGKSGSTSIACADLDGDGDLDLYVCNFGISSVLRDGGEIATRMVNGKPVVSGRHAARIKIIDGFFVEYGDPDVLYWNDGKGHFTPAPWNEAFLDENGVPMQPPLDFGLAVQIRDMNGDGLPDIYVCNDFQTPDRMWLNLGQGRFKAAPLLALRNMSYASMGVDFADLDRDGHMDFITVEMLSRVHSHHLQQSSPMRPLSRPPGPSPKREDMPRNNLYWNRGDGTYAEIAQFAGVAATDWSWAPIFIDVDLDGFEDLLVSNGHMHDVNMRDVAETSQSDQMRSVQETKSKLPNYPKLDSSKYAFRNLHNLRFEDKSTAWNFNSRAIAHGMCLLDLDLDGDQDVILNAVNEGPVIYRNESSAPRIAVRLRGLPPNHAGIGASITLRGGSMPPQTQEMISGGRYLSSDEPQRTFAAGNTQDRFELEVRWPSGRIARLQNLPANQIYEIDEDATSPREPLPRPAPAKVTPLFSPIASELSSHHEAPFDDFAVQPLLPRKLSQAGPGVALTDLNLDGHLDLILGTGAGGPLKTWIGNGKGGWTESLLLQGALPDDSTALCAIRFHADSTRMDLFAGLAQWESPSAQHPSVLHWTSRGSVTTNAAPFPSLPNSSSTGPIAFADYDGDGDLDVFVGGRFLPGRYPESASSVLYKKDMDSWVVDSEASAHLKSIPMAVCAIWVDLNLDGFPELVVTTDWGAIRVFENRQGRLTDATSTWKLDSLHGLWTGVQTIDANHDGKMDLVVGNWGMNGREQNWGVPPFRLYFGDLANDGSTQLLEAFQDPTLSKIVPSRDFALLRTSFPALRAQIQTHAAYSTMSVDEIFGEDLKKAKQLQINTLSSVILINKGTQFEALTLPTEAQWAPIYGLSVADFDGDGYDDIVAAQNCFAVRNDDSRQDSGRGLFLKGDGRTGFQPMPATWSGIEVYGEQRGSAVGDVNEDGRPDLVLTQNGGPPQVYLNQKGKPGLQIKIEGPPGNPDGIGAIITPLSTPQNGPSRTIHAGSGYWSQDALSPLLTSPHPITAVEVRWPGGRTTTTAVRPDTHNLTITAPKP